MMSLVLAMRTNFIFKHFPSILYCNFIVNYQQRVHSVETLIFGIDLYIQTLVCTKYVYTWYIIKSLYCSNVNKQIVPAYICKTLVLVPGVYVSMVSVTTAGKKFHTILPI